MMTNLNKIHQEINIGVVSADQFLVQLPGPSPPLVYRTRNTQMYQACGYLSYIPTSDIHPDT